MESWEFSGEFNIPGTRLICRAGFQTFWRGGERIVALEKRHTRPPVAVEERVTPSVAQHGNPTDRKNYRLLEKNGGALQKIKAVYCFSPSDISRI
ncbi:MAG: hypothetical protein IPK15_20740 [Verrucomicrobia bacterium]|nr:hypothetical protein [Verrucomicrobiota bacterium]